VHLVLADGSPNHWESESSGKIGDMTWEYFHISGSRTYFKRMAEACRRVSTEFMFFIDHEECILWTGVENALEFLRRNPDFSCSGGRADTTQLSWRRLSLVPHYGSKNSFSMIEEESLERCEGFSKKARTRCLMYQVRRASEAKKFAFAVEHVSLEGTSRYFVEYLHHFSLALSGKYEGADYPYWLRNGGSTPAATSDRSWISGDETREACLLILNAFGDKLQGSAASLSDSAIECYTESVMKMSRNKKALDHEQEIMYVSARKNLETFLRTVLVQATTHVMHHLFDLWPSVYQKLRPSGLRTFEKYAEHYAPGSERVLDDLLRIERVWRNYPVGISAAEFDQFGISNSTLFE
jgi:hypothetical protein